MPEQLPIYFQYHKEWSRGLLWWECVVLLFQRVTLSVDDGHIIACKHWRGKIYVVGEGTLDA